MSEDQENAWRATSRITGRAQTTGSAVCDLTRRVALGVGKLES